MTYNHFICILKKHQTPRIKALALPKSCAPHKIPQSFASLLPDIIELLEKHIHYFCLDAHQILALFGLQPTSVTINTDMPINANRIINEQEPTNHLCCSLTYLVTSKLELEHIESWQDAQTIMIDFTSGLVMDGPRYMSMLFGGPLAGIAYGNLDHTKLAKIWTT
jgi:hypothetical protein